MYKLEYYVPWVLQYTYFFSKHCNTNRLCLILLRIHLSFQKSFPQYLADSSCCVCSQSVKLLSNYMETLCEISSSCCGFIEESTTILSVNVKCERIHSHLWKLLQIHKKLHIHINPQQLRSRSKSRNFSVFNRSSLLFECHMYEKLIILKFLLFLFKEKRISAIPRKLETEGNTLCNIKH